jgi:hypothetical protein
MNLSPYPRLRTRAPASLNLSLYPLDFSACAWVLGVTLIASAVSIYYPSSFTPDVLGSAFA